MRRGKAAQSEKQQQQQEGHGNANEGEEEKSKPSYFDAVKIIGERRSSQVPNMYLSICQQLIQTSNLGHNTIPITRLCRHHPHSRAILVSLRSSS